MSAVLTNPDLVPTRPAGSTHVPSMVRAVAACGFRFDGAWFSAAIASGIVYLVLMRRRAALVPRAEETVA